MRFEELGRGFVSRRDPAGPQPVAAGPRCALAPEGDLVCTFMVQSKLGVNDFVPLLARSSDGGATWSEPRPIWPHLTSRWSLFVSVSRAPSGELFLYGIRTPIDIRGEPFWSEATQGLKQNDLVWASSDDGGRCWSEPTGIALPIPGSAEAPGPLCVTRSGRWLACYAPYPTFDPGVEVDRAQIVVLRSDDRGRTWHSTSMLRFPEASSGGAEAWVVELADGRLVGTSWHLDHRTGEDHPNAYAVSDDGGATWSPTGSTGTLGQSTALAPLPDGRVLFVFNQRRHAPVGVWLAAARPDARAFGVEDPQVVWRAAVATQQGGSEGHAGWTDFAFGEPAAVRLPDGTLLLVLWCIQPDGRGIAYVKLRPIS